MLFNENNLKNIVEGFNTPVSVAREYFNDNMESILEDYSYVGGYLAVREELDKQVKEYAHFLYAKEKVYKELELVKESLKVSEGFYDLKGLKNSIKQFDDKPVYFTLLNAFNDELIDYAEKVIALYDNLLGTCAYYKGDFNSFYYTYFIEEEDVTEEDVLCFTIDMVKELLAD